MAPIKTCYLGDLRTEAKSLQSGAKIITDGAIEDHGRGEAFSPTDLFAASYASCVLTVIGISAKIHGFNIDGAEATTTKIMGSNPRRIAELIVEFTFPHNNYSEKERKLIELSANQCPVGNSLHPDINITKTIKYRSETEI